MYTLQVESMSQLAKSNNVCQLLAVTTKSRPRNKLRSRQKWDSESSQSGNISELNLGNVPVGGALSSGHVVDHLFKVQTSSVPPPIEYL